MIETPATAVNEGGGVPIPKRAPTVLLVLIDNVQTGVKPKMAQSPDHPWNVIRAGRNMSGVAVNVTGVPAVYVSVQSPEVWRQEIKPALSFTVPPPVTVTVRVAGGGGGGPNSAVTLLSAVMVRTQGLVVPVQSPVQPRKTTALGLMIGGAAVSETTVPRG
jgi:hypothetical protein